MKIKLSDHFNLKRLIRFVLPSITMMIFISIYSVVDGFFVSNYAGKLPFAALNLICPIPMMLGAVGFMIGTGGSAIVAKTLGERKEKLANEYFSMLVFVTIFAGIILTVLGQIFIQPIASALGAEGEMLKYCVLYARIILCALPAFMLQNVFQSFLITAEKPYLGLIVTTLAGVTNIALDFLFVGVFKFGLAGAASATALSQAVGGIVPFIYFLRKNSSLLRLTKAKLYIKVIIKTCTNGASELMTNISMSVVNIVYNIQLMKLIGEDGVSAYGVIMYVNFIFIAVFIGYSIGSAPIIGYNYGAQNHYELKNIFKKSLTVISSFGIVMTVLSQLLASPLTNIFVGYDSQLSSMTSYGLRLNAISFLFCGINIFGSSMFTALGNGVVSAAISFLRTLVFQIICVLILPIFFDITGIWIAVAAAEFLSIVITVWFIIKNRKKYHYA